LEATIKTSDKKRKREAATDSGDEEGATVTKEKKSKKDKKEKKEKTEKKRKKNSANGEGAEPEEVEQWNVGELDGGAQRQDKFLRLLGAKKAGADTNGVTKAHKGKSAASKAEADIQRQFETGVKMKFDGNGKRRGLGA